MLAIAFVMLLSFQVIAAVPVVVNSLNSNCNSSTKLLPNYYWRKYEGVIPKDAVPGGHTPSGTITYIGQVLITGNSRNGIIPASIYPDQENIVAAFNGVFKSKQYIAILCSDTPQNLVWKKAKENEIHLISDYLIVGGYDTNQPAFIGRAAYSNYLIVGKIFMESSNGLRIATPATPNEKEVKFDTFEILVYESPCAYLLVK